MRILLIFNTILFLSSFELCFCFYKENKELKKIFLENKSFFDRRLLRTKSVPTSRNINLLLASAVMNENYALARKIVEAMGDLIQNYKDLYAAVRAGKKGLEKLEALLERGVNPNGWAQVGNDGTFQFVLRTKAKKSEEDKDLCSFFKKCGIEESSPLALAQELRNKAAIEFLKKYGAKAARPIEDLSKGGVRIFTEEDPEDSEVMHTY